MRTHSQDLDNGRWREMGDGPRNHYGVERCGSRAGGASLFSKGSNLLFTLIIFSAFALLFSSIFLLHVKFLMAANIGDDENLRQTSFMN